MADKIDDGGPAFPSRPPMVKVTSTDPFTTEVVPDGMSLRDYLAAAALTGMMANPKRPNESTVLAAMHAGDAYEIADAMLAARKAKP